MIPLEIALAAAFAFNMAVGALAALLLPDMLTRARARRAARRAPAHTRETCPEWQAWAPCQQCDAIGWTTITT